MPSMARYAVGSLVTIGKSIIIFSVLKPICRPPVRKIALPLMVKLLPLRELTPQPLRMPKNWNGSARCVGALDSLAVRGSCMERADSPLAE